MTGYKWPERLSPAEREALAQTLAEPLRRALREHLDAWGPCCSRMGWGCCPEAQRLFHLQPQGDQDQLVVMAGGAS